MDNGQGFKKTPASGGMGLKTMKYRADMIGAKFEIRARDPQGVVVKVSAERPASDKTQSVHTM
jgi:signal transduction histidine kinase